MKITKEQNKILQKNSSEILKKIRTFLDKHEVKKENGEGSKFDIYTFSTFKRKGINYTHETNGPDGQDGGFSYREEEQFCWIDNEDEDINNFHITYYGNTTCWDTYFTTSWWTGDEVMKERQGFGNVSCYFYPFVDNLNHLKYNRKISFCEYESFKKFIKNQEKLNTHPLPTVEYDKIDPFVKFIDDTILNFIQPIEKIKNKITNEIKLLDKDNNGIIDVIEGNDDFMFLFKKHQKKIIEVDKKYIQHFVKLSNYLKTKRENIQNIFKILKKSSDLTDMENLLGFLKNQIHTNDLLLFHSFNMITSVVEDDLITFYEIYESFDKLNMFNSNWENEVSEELMNIGEGLKDLIYSIESMERNIVGELKHLSYVTQEGFSNLSQSVTRELQSINSTLKFNNLLTGISTYQVYKINKQTK
jgi:hypothetical protein